MRRSASRIAIAVFGVFVVGLSALGQARVAQLETRPAFGYLLAHVRTDDGSWRQTTSPYVPREGDMVFYNDHSVKWGILYKMVGSDAPFHSGLVFKRDDGSFALCEAGPNDTLTCRVLDLAPRLLGWEHTILIRQCKKTLSPEGSAAMTKWCMEREGHRYALGRLLLQATPIRARGPLRKELFGKTAFDRSGYLCAELVIAGGTLGGIFDPKVHRGNTIYPRDIVQNDVYDLSELYEDARTWLAEPIPGNGNAVAGASAIPTIRPASAIEGR